MWPSDFALCLPRWRVGVQEPPRWRFGLVAFLALLCSLLLCGRSDAAGDAKEPYRLRIVVHLARHRLLTDIFRQQLKRELQDGLQAALGKLAKVEVVDEPKGKLAQKLKDVLAQGLGRALDGWRERSDYKTHFLLIDFSGTRYQIQARQHDGLTGLSSPTVRRERTRDRDYVARTAALLIAHDLGLLGTIESEPNAAGLVTVELKGGGLGVDLGRWVKKDEVLSLVRLTGDGAGQPVPWTFLQVQTPPKDGVCTCRLFRRYPTMRVKGLRCVLLGTRTGSMRLRVVQEEPGGRYSELQSSVTLEMRRRGFEGEEGTKLSVAADSSRDVDTAAKFGDKGRFTRIAFISVMSGAQRKARIPVALVDDRIIILPVPTVDEDSTLALERYRLLRRNVLMSYLVQTDLFGEINKLTAKPDKRADALTRVKETLKRSRDDHARLSKERNDVERELAGLKLSSRERPSFTAIDNRLNQIRSAEADLRNHVTLLEKIEKEENDPKRKAWLFQVESAKLLEKDAELGQAITIYEKAPPEFAKGKALQKHLADLKKRWAVKGEEHARARYCIYKEWPGLTTSGLTAKIADAEKHFATCKKVGDTISPLRLLKANEKHLQRLLKELSALNPSVNPDDEKPTKEIGDLVPKLQKLDGEIRAYLDSKAGG